MQEPKCPLMLTVVCALISMPAFSDESSLPKQVYGDYFCGQRTREHDGAIGSWKQNNLAFESTVFEKES